MVRDAAITTYDRIAALGVSLRAERDAVERDGNGAALVANLQRVAVAGCLLGAALLLVGDCESKTG